jgi:hypothetical protein
MNGSGSAQVAHRAGRQSSRMATSLVEETHGGSFLLELLYFAGWQLQVRDGEPARIRARRAELELEVTGATLEEATGTVFERAMRSGRRSDRTEGD